MTHGDGTAVSSPADEVGTPGLTRRGLAAAAVGSVGTAVVGATAGEAAAGRRYRPRRYRATKIPGSATRHALTRFSYGWTPQLQRQVAKAGGFNRWFDRQLSGSYSDGWYRTTADWWPTTNASRDRLVGMVDSGALSSFWQVDINYQRWVLARRTRSHRQVQELMAEFWEHHFHIPAQGLVGPYRVSYGKKLRSLALGRFDALLPAAVLHPAMALYLSNANSSRSAPNEDLGRELLELHTVGRGNYTERDVRDSARLLTGYRVDKWRTWRYTYDTAHHWTGRVSIVGFTHPNAAPDGRDALRAYLRHLAHHPATARRIAHKLAVRFISDDPPASVVDMLTRVYLANDTRIAPVLRALVRSPAFRSARMRKVRTPDEDLVATYRALNARLQRPRGNSAAADGIVWQARTLGNMPYEWGSPDGRPDTADAWSSTARFLGSLDVHYMMCGGWWPNEHIAYRRRRAWLPRKSLRFAKFVDHLSRRMLGRSSTSTMLQAACEATGCQPWTVITPDHRVMKWELPRLLTVFLDSPYHMKR
ncbi:DUF1800 domain-containing protein [Nocardioides panacisoli]|uniref:DUF1800 domain-containing protein n=1 Tax=Nocardioides panacisoli TaxID=627624 RepID=UPI001C6350CD|nr:DUF1800 domain-containing protein [Nocardioides panacisoli]QYJ03341.1 DUF1800 domain-containing protein [Nocardioides panacisoli]